MKQWDFKYFNSNFGKYPGRHPNLIFFMENTWQPADSFGIRQTIAVISNNYISKYFNSHFSQLSERFTDLLFVITMEGYVIHVLEFSSISLIGFPGVK
jgi:hypothetical protein